MKKLTSWLYINRSVEEIIFSCILIAGVPYFAINEIIDLATNQSLAVFLINSLLLVSIIYLLGMSIRKEITKTHIFVFSLVLSICFTLFWPASTGLSGAGAYVLHSLIIVLLLVNTGRAASFFAVFAVVMILVAGFVDIDYKGKIVYTSQLTSFVLNMLVVGLIMNIFNIALDRERLKLISRITKLDKINTEITEKNIALEENQEEIKRIQTHLQQIIKDRTEEIENKNQQLIEYTFINAHLVRAPLANMLALCELIESDNPKFEALRARTKKLDDIVRKIGGVLAVKK